MTCALDLIWGMVVTSDLAAVSMLYREGNRLSLQSGRTAAHGAPKAVPMCLAVFGRHDKVQGLTDSLRERIAERLLGASAPEADHPVSIGEHDRFLVHASPPLWFRPLSRDPRGT